jgi:hypothetical protein
VLIPIPDTGARPWRDRRRVLAVRGKTPVTIGDVAKVSEAPALRSGDAVVMGRPGGCCRWPASMAPTL